ncbi:DUF402 domain-containing protein [Phytoactinopolyspora endophytica]|uniref:DUF402 domain-containing protein n=1 Tax=Phytoactinopolyspora endophytica TaxID=1642495 RepID=UPI00101CF0CD|nr:DUF402 domain-containing protein [Phytoactinopolyspora endophytica]
MDSQSTPDIEPFTLPGQFRPSGAPPHYQAGQHILWREWCPTRRHRGPEVVRPVTVVRDDPSGLVVWLSAGTPVFRAVLSDGRDFRQTPVNERHRHGRASKRGAWHGNGVLKIAPTGVPWSVWVFWDEEWNHRCWYINLEDAHRRDAAGIVTRDHELDVVVWPDRTTEIQDEDDLAASVAAGRYTEADAAQYARDAEAAVQAVQEWTPPFSSGWESWRPDPAWPIPQMPASLTSDY